MSAPRTDTPTLISAMRILSHDIQSEDGVANAAIAEAADRLEEQHSLLAAQGTSIDRLQRKADGLIARNEELEDENDDLQGQVDKKDEARSKTVTILERIGRIRDIRKGAILHGDLDEELDALVEQGRILAADCGVSA